MYTVLWETKYTFAASIKGKEQPGAAYQMHLINWSSSISKSRRFANLLVWNIQVFVNIMPSNDCKEEAVAAH